MKRKNKKNKRNASKISSLSFKKIIHLVKKILFSPFFLILKLPEEIKRYLTGIFFLSFSIFILLSDFKKGGFLGEKLLSLGISLFGNYPSKIFLPIFFLLVSLCYFFSRYKKIFLPIFLSFLLTTFGISTLFEISKEGRGGFFGKILIKPLFKLFGPLLSDVLLFFSILIGIYILAFLLKREEKIELKPSFFKRIFGPSFKVNKIEVAKVEEKKMPISEKKEVEKKIETFQFEYQAPPLELLEKDQGMPAAGDIKQNIAVIKKTLENFGIPVEMGEVNVGPTVTQYTLKPADGIKLSKITSLSNDLALSLASHPIRIEAPIPGKSLVGIEVPNKVRTLVRLRNLISDPQFQNHPSPLCFVLGRDVSGNPVFGDLARMPHLLVCGATGTGKTLFLNSLILSLVYRNSPKILKFILVDPKRVEFPVYSDLPHNLTDVIFDVQKTINALKWLVEEMERRFETLAKVRVRDIFSFNKVSIEKKNPPMPYIVLIIDELADLMMAKGREIEAVIVRLAQLARAVGIHLVLATQRPSTEVITGLIKANITSRISFQVASQVDSRTVIDTGGAEKLLGRGDMLFLSAENPKPKRIQGAFVSEKEVQKVVEYLSSKYKKEKIESLEEKLLAEENGGAEFFEGEENWEDPLYEEAKRTVIEARRASASLLQRRLKIGYARAARLLDILEKRGIVGPSRGAKPREVYIKEEEEWQKV
jgi:S-DNA-T family DNA segregation ATPase FtsK/SpoIIIE